ncbi:MAG: hypothetical protein COA84_01115 [Robiginitomaculum sp.]|nr:MAG: hypothetical protein COA84_01115 [Robiginitomaculum sp.]
MTDKEFLHAFETTDLSEADFNHAAHVRAGFLLIHRHGFSRALAHYCEALRALTEHFGVPEKYHETITIAYLALINEQISHDPGGNWTAFCKAHPDVFSKEALAVFYTPAQLATPQARATFILPRPGQRP